MFLCLDLAERGGSQHVRFWNSQRTTCDEGGARSSPRLWRASPSIPVARDGSPFFRTTVLAVTITPNGEKVAIFSLFFYAR